MSNSVLDYQCIQIDILHGNMRPLAYLGLGKLRQFLVRLLYTPILQRYICDTIPKSRSSKDILLTPRSSKLMHPKDSFKHAAKRI